MSSGSRPIVNLADIVIEQARRNGGAVALEYRNKSLTYAELDEVSGRGAAALAAAGVKPGDRVAILAKNSDLFFELLIACSKLNAILLPLNWRLTAQELSFILSDAYPGAVIVAAEFIGVLNNALEISGIHPLMLMIDQSDDGRQSYEPWRASYAPRLSDNPDGESGALLLYTSGTTGKPKGAIIPQRALVKMRQLEAEGPAWLRWKSTDTCLVSMPLFHIAGIRTALNGLYNGSRIHLLTEFNADEVLDVVAAGGVTKLYLVPAAMQTLARHPRRQETDFSELEYIIYGGSPISLGLLKECMAAFGCGFVQAYGSTETAGGVLTLGPQDHDPEFPQRMASVGQPLPGVEIRILRRDGSTADVQEIGEVAIRGPSTMVGYWRLPDATREVLDAAGWLRMGDLGLLDAEGYLHLRDRAKDMIITGGENVYPVEVENALASHPAVAEVAVFGAPSDRWGEEVRAVVVLRRGEAASAEDLIAWARRQVAAYKAPKVVSFVDSLPRNAGGKVMKRELRENVT